MISTFPMYPVIDDDNLVAWAVASLVFLGTGAILILVVFGRVVRLALRNEKE